MTFADAKQRFSNRVADYVRYRPSYPAALLDMLRHECGLQSNHVIADVGSGTGLLSKLFLENGNRVYGVEPNPEMRAAGEEFLRDYENFSSVTGSAEGTSLRDSSVDFVVAGQAFHWFNPVATGREFRRILKPPGQVVVLWHERRVEGAPFTAAYEQLLERFGIDYGRVKEAYPEPEKLRAFFTTFSSRDLPNHQEFDWEGLCGRLRSSSFVPASGHANFEPMMAELRRIFLAHEQGGRVRMEHVLRIYFGRLD